MRSNAACCPGLLAGFRENLGQTAGGWCHSACPRKHRWARTTREPSQNHQRTIREPSQNHQRAGLTGFNGLASPRYHPLCLSPLWDAPSQACVLQLLLAPLTLPRCGSGSGRAGGGEAHLRWLSALQISTAKWCLCKHGSLSLTERLDPVMDTGAPPPPHSPHRVTSCGSGAKVV